MNREILFPTPIYFKMVKDPKKLNKYLYPLIKAWSKKDKTEIKTNAGGGWHSPTDMNFKKEYKPLTDELFAMQEEIYKDYEPSEEFIQLTVVAVEPNYLDDYIVNLKKTWVRAMEVQKELGYVVDYGVFTSDNANSPNVWLTITYENMAAMQPSEEQYNKVNAELEKRYTETEDELNTIAKGYEEIRKMVDNQIINRVVFK